LHGLIDLDATNTNIDESDAADLARRLLRDVGTRLAHSASVAHQAGRVAHLLDEPWRSAITQAAWLHDIGYSEQVARTGFHPLDGARWLRERGWPAEICRLVAWHTAASVEGNIRGLDADRRLSSTNPQQWSLQPSRGPI
jgi:putative nucleotidyltransferase with HDIG domain